MADPKAIAEMLKYFAQTPEGAVTGVGMRDDARRGELGYLKDTQGNYNTEISSTINDPRLNQGMATNIPMLVQGQIGIPDLQLMKRPTDEQYNIAVQRAIDRQKSGGMLPSYQSLEEAIKAAEERPVSSKKPYFRGR
jgi:hypothetical protein